jgi:hypothetical protein
MRGALTEEERRQLAVMRDRLIDAWGLNDVKRSNSPRLAFIGLASWIDTLAILSTGRKKKNKPAWRHFLKTYMPAQFHSDAEITRLYEGLRCKLLHEYGTRGVLLTHGSPNDHWACHDDHRMLNLESLIAEFEAGFECFYADLEKQQALRERVLPHVDGLLTEVIVQVPSHVRSPTLSLGPVLAVRSVSASPTAPLPSWLTPTG